MTTCELWAGVGRTNEVVGGLDDGRWVRLLSTGHPFFARAASKGARKPSYVRLSPTPCAA